MILLKNGFCIYRIVITGGPCSGKTSAMEMLPGLLKKEGYEVLVMHETATELISGGIAPWTCKNPDNYQWWQMKLMRTKEEVYLGAAKEIAEKSGKSVIILYDRAMLDNKAYMEQKTYKSFLKRLGLKKTLSWYDGVFHLETAAKGAIDAYNLTNNSSRTETAEEAIRVNDRTIEAWKDYPAWTVIDNSTGFDEKMDRLFKGILGRIWELDSRSYPEKALEKDRNYSFVLSKKKNIIMDRITDRNNECTREVNNMNMSDNVKKILLAGVGTFASTTEKAKEIIEDMAKKGEITVEESKILNSEFAENLKTKTQDLKAKSQDFRENIRKKAAKPIDDIDFSEMIAGLSSERLEALKEEIAQFEAAKDQIDSMAEEAEKEAPAADAEETGEDPER